MGCGPEFLLTMLFCCHNLVRIDHCSTLYGNIPSGSKGTFAIKEWLSQRCKEPAVCGSLGEPRDQRLQRIGI